MSIKLIPMKCPCCGASIENADSPWSATCTYCDTKFIVDHGELRKYEASDVNVFYADNRIVEASVPAWAETTYHSLINAIKPFSF